MTLNLYPSKYPLLALCLWGLTSCTEVKESSEDSEHIPEPKELQQEVQDVVDEEPPVAVAEVKVQENEIPELSSEVIPDRPLMTVEQPVVLRDIQGRSIRAEVLSFTSDAVNIVKSDSKRHYTILLETLSPESRSLLQRIQKEQVAILEWEAKYSDSVATEISNSASSVVTDDSEHPSEISGYWYAKLADYRGNAKRIVSTPLRRASKPLTISTKDASLSLTIAPDGSGELKRDGKRVSSGHTHPWSVVDWTKGYVSTGKVAKDVLRYPLKNMQSLGNGELLLWSDDERYRVIVKITGKSRHLNFELVHVSDDPMTGHLSNNWQGHQVEFDIKTQAQSDGWRLNTLLLNPMSELNTRSKHREDDRSYFTWPYAYWAQTEDRPQPQGMIALHGFASDDEFDDVMIDVWAEEPSLPRPHRAIHSKWSRKEIEAWLDKVVAFHSPSRKMFSFEPNGDPESFYKIAELAAKHDVNAIGLHNWNWQGLTIGEPNPNHFPNGMKDVRKVQKFYEKRGIQFKLHGFGGIFMTRDSKYGEPRVDENLENRGLAIAARGTIVEDVKANQKTFLLKPDLSLYPWMKPWMLPYSAPAWGLKNSGYGNTFPPFFEGSHSTIAFQGRVRTYTCVLTKENLWKVTLGSWRGTSNHSGLKKGDVVNFIVNGTPSWMVPDPRSEMYVEMAEDYSNILNEFQSRPVYDGAGWSEPYGTWGLRKMVQMVYERLDHPVEGHEHFGFTDQMFKRVKKVVGNRPRGMSMVLGSLASLTSSIDDAHHSLTATALSKDIYVRGNHKGIAVSYAEDHGAWAEMLDALRIWQDLKQHLSDVQKEQISKRFEKLRNTRKFFYTASETDDTWLLTKTQAMHRAGIDGSWKLIPERPAIATRQFLKANGSAVDGLENPYAAQVPELELHVMAGMSTESEENLSLMPKSGKDLVQPKTGHQKLQWSEGTLQLSYDNSRSSREAVSYFKPAKETLPYWFAKPLYGKQLLDFSDQRGISITVEGDGSGAVLLFSYGPSFPRSFAIDIDFVGKRTFEFPNGEMINNRYDWDAFAGQSITSFKYQRVDRFQLYFNRVPAGSKASVRVLDVRTMTEDQSVGLVEPTLDLNGSLVKVNATIPYNHYLRYSGGSKASIFDQNWHFVREVKVSTKGEFIAQSGGNSFSISSSGSPQTFFSIRLKVRDEDNVIKINKP